MRGPGERKVNRRGRAGFSIVELTVLLGVLGALFTLSLPTFVTYYQSSRVREAASEIAALVNQGRQLAIQMNCSVAVEITSAAITFVKQASCQAPGIWRGAGTDAAGNIRTPEGVTLTANATPTFNHLGAAAPAATLTVTHGRRSLSVIVAASGRVSIGP